MTCSRRSLTALWAMIDLTGMCLLKQAPSAMSSNKLTWIMIFPKQSQSFAVDDNMPAFPWWYGGGWEWICVGQLIPITISDVDYWVTSHDSAQSCTSGVILISLSTTMQTENNRIPSYHAIVNRLVTYQSRPSGAWVRSNLIVCEVRHFEKIPSNKY